MEFGPRALGARSILGDPRSPDDAEDAQPQGQVSRMLPALRARRCCARTSPTGSSSTTTAPTCCWSPTWSRSRRRAMTAAEEALFGIDKLNVPRSDIPAVTHVDYSARVQTVHAETNPRYPRAARGLQGADRLPGAGQHQLQRARRADRLHAGGRLPLLHGHARSTCWWSAIASCARRTRIRRSSSTTRTPSSSTSVHARCRLRSPGRSVCPEDRGTPDSRGRTGRGRPQGGRRRGQFPRCPDGGRRLPAQARAAFPCPAWKALAISMPWARA